MKKYIFYILLFIFIIFVIPALCTRGSIETLAIEQNSQDEDIKKYDLLNSIFTQFREGKRFKPADDVGFV